MTDGISIEIDPDNFDDGIELEAKLLDYTFLGNLVTITLPSGATISDILTGIHMGDRVAYGKIHVRLANVEAGARDFSEGGGWNLDPESPVWTYRPLDAAE